jgi:hypothetical protein
MDNRISQIRKKIRALRVSMLEAEAVMHEQVKRDEDCSCVAGRNPGHAERHESAGGGAESARRPRADPG